MNYRYLVPLVAYVVMCCSPCNVVHQGLSDVPYVDCCYHELAEAPETPLYRVTLSDMNRFRVLENGDGTEGELIYISITLRDDSRDIKEDCRVSTNWSGISNLDDPDGGRRGEVDIKDDHRLLVNSFTCYDEDVPVYIFCRPGDNFIITIGTVEHDSGLRGCNDKAYYHYNITLPSDEELNLSVSENCDNGLSYRFAEDGSLSGLRNRPGYALENVGALIRPMNGDICIYRVR